MSYQTAENSWVEKSGEDIRTILIAKYEGAETSDTQVNSILIVFIYALIGVGYTGVKKGHFLGFISGPPSFF